MAAGAVLLSLCFGALVPCPENMPPLCTSELSKGKAWRVAVSHDDTLVAAADSQDGLRVFNVATGAAVAVPSYSSAFEAAFSPDGGKVAAALTSRGVAVISLSSGTELWSDNTRGGGVCHTVAYSPDGKRVVAGYKSGDIVIWDAVTGDWILTIPAPDFSDNVRGLTYTLDGGRIISGTIHPDNVYVWDAMTGALLKTLTDHTSNVLSTQVSPDGLYFASMGATNVPDTVNIYKLSDYSVHKKITQVMGHFDTSYDMSFNRDWSKLVVVGHGGIKFYTVDNGSLAQAYDVDSPSGVSYFHNSDAFITGGSEPYSADIFLWDYVATPAQTPSPPTPSPLTPSPPTPAPPTPSPPTPSPPTPAPPAASPAPTPVTPVPRSCEASDTFATRRCGVGASLRCVLRIQHAGRVLSVAHSPDGAEIVAGDADGVVRVFSAADGTQLRSLACGGFVAHDVSFSPDGARVAAGGAGGRAVVCDATTGAVLLDLEHGDAAAAPVRRVRFSPDGRLLVTGGVEVLRVHDAVAGLRPQLVLYEPVGDVALAPAGAGSGSGGAAAQLAAVAEHTEAGEVVRVFAVDNGQREAAVASVGAHVTALSFSPDGDELARGMDDGTVRVGQWAGNGPSERMRLQHESGIVFDVQHSPDGRLVAAAGVGPVVVWGTSGGAAAAVLVGHVGCVRRLSFSPSGTRVATAGHDGQLLLWDVSGL